jgi:hypothetical protein
MCNSSYCDRNVIMTFFIYMNDIYYCFSLFCEYFMQCLYSEFYMQCGISIASIYRCGEINITWKSGKEHYK